MKHLSSLCALSALLASTLLTLPAQASSFASSASDGVSDSVGASSNSIGRSSDSSSKKDKDTAAGDYQVVEMVAVAERPGQLRLTLQPAGGGEDQRLYLYVPEDTVNSAAIGPGQTVTALRRDYGLAFAKTLTATPFFLVVQDAWLHELPSKAVL